MLLFPICTFLKWIYIATKGRFVDPEKESLKVKKWTDVEERIMKTCYMHSSEFQASIKYKYLKMQ